MAQLLLDYMEATLTPSQQADATTTYDQLLGPKGLVNHLPKMVKLLEMLESPVSKARTREKISPEDIALLKEWLAARQANGTARN